MNTMKITKPLDPNEVAKIIGGSITSEMMKDCHPVSIEVDGVTGIAFVSDKEVAINRYVTVKPAEPTSERAADPRKTE